MSQEFRQVTAQMACFCPMPVVSIGRLNAWRLRHTCIMVNDGCQLITCGSQLKCTHGHSMWSEPFHDMVFSFKGRASWEREPSPTLYMAQSQRSHSITSFVLYWMWWSQTLVRCKEKKCRAHLSVGTVLATLYKEQGNRISTLIQLSL